MFPFFIESDFVPSPEFQYFSIDSKINKAQSTFCGGYKIVCDLVKAMNQNETTPPNDKRSIYTANKLIQFEFPTHCISSTCIRCMQFLFMDLRVFGKKKIKNISCSRSFWYYSMLSGTFVFWSHLTDIDDTIELNQKLSNIVWFCGECTNTKSKNRWMTAWTLNRSVSILFCRKFSAFEWIMRIYSYLYKSYQSCELSGLTLNKHKHIQWIAPQSDRQKHRKMVKSDLLSIFA